MMNISEFKQETEIDDVNRKEHFDKTAISPYNTYCDGYGMSGSTGNGYIAALKVDAGTVKKTDDELLDGIVSYDRAETQGAYIGQINMITASSFDGLQGQIWGHDVAVHDDIANHRVKPLFVDKQWNGSDLPIYDAKPLLDSAVELFGTEEHRRFHPVPGGHIFCANKGVTAERPKDDRPLKAGEAYGVWSFIAISFAENGQHDSDLFIEDAGLWTKNTDKHDLVDFLNQRRKDIAWSVAECGKDSHVQFDSTWIGYAYTMMNPGEIGNAITVGPYVTIAKDALPSSGKFDDLSHETLSDWLNDHRLASLTRVTA